MIRAFAAVPVPCAPAMSAFLAELRHHGETLKVVADDRLHVTCKFFPDLPESQVALFLEALANRDLPDAWQARMRSAGAFPDWNRPRVLWAGIEDAEARMQVLAGHVDEAAADLGHPREERGFRAHVTVARTRKAKPDPAIRAVLESHRDRDWGDIDVDRVVLFESRLDSKGPSYRVRGSVPL